MVSSCAEAILKKGKASSKFAYRTVDGACFYMDKEETTEAGTGQQENVFFLISTSMGTRRVFLIEASKV